MPKKHDEREEKTITTVYGEEVAFADVEHILEPLRPFAVRVDTLNLDPKNARKHDDENLSDIRGSLEEYGFSQVMLVDKKTMIVRDGNGRTMVCPALKWKYAPALLIDEASERQIGRVLALNRSAETAEWSPEALSELVHLIPEPNSAALRRMFMDFDVMVERAVAKDRLLTKRVKDEAESAGGAEKKGFQKMFTEANAMDLQPGEHHDYIVVYCSTRFAWNELLNRMGVIAEGGDKDKGARIGRGRAISGERLLDLWKEIEESGKERSA